MEGQVLVGRHWQSSWEEGGLVAGDESRTWQGKLGAREVTCWFAGPNLAATSASMALNGLGAGKGAPSWSK